MKKVILLISIFLHAIYSYGQDWKLEGDDVYVNGKKICSIVYQDSPFTLCEIKDVTGVARLEVSRQSKILYFVDDDQSYVVKFMDKKVALLKNALAESLSKEELFCSSGFNEDKKLKFVQNNMGVLYDKNTVLPISLEKRDKTKEITSITSPDEEYVFAVQDGVVIGKTVKTKGNDRMSTYKYYNMYGVQIASGTSLLLSNGVMESYVSSSSSIPEKFSEKNPEVTYDALYKYNWAFKLLGNKGLFDFNPDGQSGNNSQSITTPSSNSSAPEPVKAIASPTSTNNTAPTKTASTNTTPSPSSFSTYSTKSSEKLETMKKDAVAKNDFDAAAAIKTELDLRKAEQEKVANFQKDLDAKVKAEDYAGASQLQKEIGPLKEKVAKKDQLRKDIDAAVAGQDYEKAEKLKQELKTLY